MTNAENRMTNGRRVYTARDSKTAEMRGGDFGKGMKEQGNGRKPEGDTARGSRTAEVGTGHAKA